MTNTRTASSSMPKAARTFTLGTAAAKTALQEAGQQLDAFAAAARAQRRAEFERSINAPIITTHPAAPAPARAPEDGWSTCTVCGEPLHGDPGVARCDDHMPGGVA